MRQMKYLVVASWLLAVGCGGGAGGEGASDPSKMRDKSGKLKVSERPARTGRNPQTGASIQIAARKVVKFVPAKALSDAIN